MIASFNSWCDVCNGFSVTNLINVDVDVDVDFTASRKTQKRTRQRSFSSSEALPKIFNAIMRVVCLQKFQSVKPVRSNSAIRSLGSLTTRTGRQASSVHKSNWTFLRT